MTFREYIESDGNLANYLLEEVAPANRVSVDKAVKVAEMLGISDEVDIEELRMGMEVEQEHLETLKQAAERADEDPDIATAIIALDHLKELPDYYTRLKKMESEE